MANENVVELDESNIINHKGHIIFICPLLYGNIEKLMRTETREYINDQDYYLSTESTINNGLHIVYKDNGDLWNIKEYKNKSIINTIQFKPTEQIIVDYAIQYSSTYNSSRYVQFRNNKNKLYKFYFKDKNDKFSGEYLNYDVYGTITERLFLIDGNIITKDVKDFISFNGDKKDFINYKFKDYEIFQLLCRYGNEFKFISECTINVDEIIKKI